MLGLPGGLEYLLLLVIVLIVGTVALVLVWELREKVHKTERRTRLEARPVLEVDAWYRAYFAPAGCSRETTIEVLSALGAVLHVDMTRLRSADSFNAELAVKDVMGFDADDEMEYFSEVVLEGMVPAGSLEHVRGSRTVGELVERVAAARGEDQRF